ncbi:MULTISPECIES: hypothetical protein [unclassified Prochlorococcus]|uniref:hypothetical protein n=1 Tax=unclassified Prochlorococcus TaxID=2627481 RepID=UPI000533B2FF|nr:MULTISPECIES: hypothetical protein [unclassified Prochlorococcus]KGG27663.1 hypothetical protein EV13_2067 [Prochlorococcus sp. MIT 0702]KGG37277.1 hypothetical protein EV14_0069 [Prochlorococcus sp. MIT 0703]
MSNTSPSKASPLAEWFIKAFTPGWGYVIEVNGVKAFRSGHPSAKMLSHHLGLSTEEPSYLVIRPSRTTQWIAFDIDQARSPYHPDRGDDAINTLLERCALMGLREPLVFRSSHSGGIHLWYPLAQPVKAFDAALTVKLCLEAGAIDAGELGESIDFTTDQQLKISSGLLEVFPNVKQVDSDYTPIRLPFTGQGNGLLLDGFGLVEEPALLADRWNVAAKNNVLVQSIRLRKRELGSGPYNLVDDDNEVICINWIKARKRTVANQQLVYADKGEQPLKSLTKQSGEPTSLQDAHDLLARGWTGSNQTQHLCLSALMVASQLSNDSDEVANYVKELLIHAKGFADHCDHIRQIQSGELPGRSACQKAARFTSSYEGSWKEVANQAKAKGATERALGSIAAASNDGVIFTSINKAIIYLREHYGAPSKAWWFKSQNNFPLESLKGFLAP